MNDDEKQGWDKIAEQERKKRQIRNASKFGSGLWFVFELFIGGIIVILLIIGIIIWLNGG